MTVEPLHEDLRPHIEMRSIPFAMLKHPLVFVALFDESRIPFANRSYLAKKMLLEEARENKEWGQVINLYERPFRLNAFLSIADELSDPDYWRLAGDVWGDSENIYENQQEWLDVLSTSRGQREHFMSSEDRMQLQRLSDDELTIYRGATKLDPAPFSWTLDRDKAIWFSQRLAGINDSPSAVYEVRIQKSDIFALISDRGENEVIIEPDSLELVLATRIVSEPRVKQHHRI